MFCTSFIYPSSKSEWHLVSTHLDERSYRNGADAVNLSTNEFIYHEADILTGEYFSISSSASFLILSFL